MLTDMEIQTEREHYVVMRNELINDMEYKLSRQQLLLLRYMIKQIKPEDKPEQNYTITIKAFCQIIGITDGGRNYHDIKKNLNLIDNQTRWLESVDTIERIKWFNRLRIRKKDGTIEYSFHESITEYLFNLIHSKEGYTKYHFDEIVVMDTKYGIRLYEFVREHLNAGHRYVNIPIEDLKGILGGTNYKTFKDFRRNILDKAIAEVNQYSIISVKGEGKPKKGERVYSYVRFEIESTLTNGDNEEFWYRSDNMSMKLTGKPVMY